MKKLALLSLLMVSQLCFGQNLTGKWTWGKEATSGGTLKVIERKGRLSFQLTCYQMRSKQAVGTIAGDVTIKKNKGTFRSPALADCVIQFTIKPKAIILEQTGKGDCEFGTGVQADGAYQRVSKTKPVFD